jgi:Zn-dependent peptidase ImmA (M78 family)
VVDTGDTPYARIFSVLHEYAHLTLRSAGICDLDDHSTIERYCNAAAAAALVPDELLVGRVSAVMFLGSDESADDALRQLSRQLHGSQATILIALRERFLITQETYDAMDLRRRSRHGGSSGPSGGQYYRTEINRVGRLFARRVVGALSDGVIDRQDASVLLNIGEQNVARYVRELAQGD